MSNGTDQSPDWERNLLSKIALSAVAEQRRTRRWGIFFKLLFFAYIVFATWLFYNALNPTTGPGATRHTAVVRVDGMIAADADASAGRVIAGLRAAFEADNSAGVVLLLNSPGGSPVQSGQIYDAMLKLRDRHPGKPLYAVISDACASGCYYVAAAAQEIYADKASIVGSIGVRADSFGFVEAMDKLGVERRLYTAGESKGLLDPFSPENPAQVAHFESLLSEVHEQFIGAVKNGRGDRLADRPALFSGLVWTGEQSVELGLVDGLNTTRGVAEALLDAEELVDYTVGGNPLERVLDRIGISVGDRIAELFTLKLY